MKRKINNYEKNSTSAGGSSTILPHKKIYIVAVEATIYLSTVRVFSVSED